MTGETEPQTEWTTEELQRDFEVKGFSTGICVVKRKSDGQLGSLVFDGHPRRYYGWAPHEGGDRP